MEKKRFFVTVALIILLAMFASQFSKWEGNSYTGHSIWDQNIEDLVEFKEIKNLNVRKEGLFTNIGVDTGLFVVVDNGKKELLLKSGFNLNSYSMRDNFEGKEGSVIWIEYVPKGRLYYEELDYDGVLISYNSDMEPRKIIIQDLLEIKSLDLRAPYFCKYEQPPVYSSLVVDDGEKELKLELDYLTKEQLKILKNKLGIRDGDLSEEFNTLREEWGKEWDKAHENSLSDDEKCKEKEEAWRESDVYNDAYSGAYGGAWKNKVIWAEYYPNPYPSSDPYSPFGSYGQLVNYELAI